MRFMNDYDIRFAQHRFAHAAPRRYALSLVVDTLRAETNSVSDGWAYWSKPCRAAEKAIRLIESTTNRANDEQERVDCTEEEKRAALRPIKSFLTRHAHVYDPAQRERILAAASA